MLFKAHAEATRLTTNIDRNAQTYLAAIKAKTQSKPIKGVLFSFAAIADDFVPEISR